MNNGGGTPAPAGAVNGGWYNGEQDENGVLGAPGVITNPNEQGAGSTVSATVANQTNPNNAAFLEGEGANLGQPANAGSGSGTGLAGSNVFGNAPTAPNLTSIYDQYYTNNPDVASTQSSITDLQGQLTQRQQALDTATSNVNDNPFYAEATRVGKVSQLNSDAQNDMNTITNQLNTQQTNLTNYESEAERQVNLAQGQYTIQNQQWQQNMSEFNTLLSAGGLEDADSATMASLSVSTGIPSSMLQSIQSSEQAKNTQIITSTDDSGNVSVVAVNATTGKVINSTTLAGIGAAKTSSAGSSTTKAQDVATTYMNLQGDITGGADLKSLISHYAVPGGLTESQILQTYNNLSPYGAAKETSAQIKAGQYADAGSSISGQALQGDVNNGGLTI